MYSVSAKLSFVVALTPVTAINTKAIAKIEIVNSFFLHSALLASDAQRQIEDKVKGICYLLNDMGIPYWIDVDGTYSGENFKEVIVNAIKQSQLVLFVSTKNSNASLNVAKEISLADKYNKVVIPIKLDNSPFAPKIDYDLNCIDAIELYDFTQEQMEKLRKCIQGKLAIEDSKVK